MDSRFLRCDAPFLTQILLDADPDLGVTVASNHQLFHDIEANMGMQAIIGMNMQSTYFAGACEAEGHPGCLPGGRQHCCMLLLFPKAATAESPALLPVPCACLHH